MELKEAMVFLMKDRCNANSPTRDEIKLIDMAMNAISAAGFCPYCAELGEKVRLRDWEAGDSYHNAGRECPECEEFIICGEQPEYSDEPDCHSDADPGL